MHENTKVRFLRKIAWWCTRGVSWTWGALRFSRKNTLPWVPKEWAFFESFAPTLLIKKTAPGNSRFMPTDIILQEFACKILLWKKWLVFCLNTVNQRESPKYPEIINNFRKFHRKLQIKVKSINLPYLEFLAQIILQTKRLRIFC